MSSLRPWVVWHIPHASTEIPPHIRDQFLLSDDELRTEAELVADTAADDLYVRDGDKTPWSSPGRAWYWILSGSVATLNPWKRMGWG